MKEGIGGVFLFNIVIMFILLFTGIMTLTINRSRAFAVKEEVIAEIEKYGANITGENLVNIANILDETSYRSDGKCSEGYIAFDRDGKKTGNSGENSYGSICIKEIPINVSDIESEHGCYYSVELFYKIEMPMVEDVLTFKVVGETKTLYNQCIN